MSPCWSEDVNFWWDSFHVTTWICPWCPSSVWFIDKLEGAARPLILPSLPVSNFKTFKSPSSPPQAMYPCSRFHPTHFNFVLLGIAIFLLKYINIVVFNLYHCQSLHHGSLNHFWVRYVKCHWWLNVKAAMECQVGFVNIEHGKTMGHWPLTQVTMLLHCVVSNGMCSLHYWEHYNHTHPLFLLLVLGSPVETCWIKNFKKGYLIFDHFFINDQRIMIQSYILLQHLEVTNCLWIMILIAFLDLR